MEGRPGDQSICGQAAVLSWWGQINLENSDLFCRHSGAQTIAYLSHELWTDDFAQLFQLRLSGIMALARCAACSYSALSPASWALLAPDRSSCAFPSAVLLMSGRARMLSKRLC